MNDDELEERSLCNHLILNYRRTARKVHKKKIFFLALYKLTFNDF